MENIIDLLSSVTVFEWLLLILLKTDIVVQYLRLKEEKKNVNDIKMIRMLCQEDNDLLLRLASFVTNPKKGVK